ncbi:GNAT family N-acetyltransferase [Paraburkholderia edwinii]|jgi:putative acetyltransferase|uniref:GNAT family N-acetyltransferase n=1 Tax=Paraburkholderia edwinii TaxID=2861782 RepID=A0ABX8UN59_9BURK|nr:GNAT family N-acetyltransferase [Paraburkholderia edwinii]QYD70443.1 GNAT family N-acetyltransferase [Paraburkholderia edwinii]
MAINHIEWRTLRAGDTPVLAELFRDAVMQLAASHYDEAGRVAWAASADDLDAFGARLTQGLTLVAVSSDAIAAFGQLHPADHVSMLYTAPAFAGQGIAWTLLARFEAVARAAGTPVLTAHASASAKRSFERAGFHVLEEENLDRNGVSLKRFRMQKPLVAAHIPQ